VKKDKLHASIGLRKKILKPALLLFKGNKGDEIGGESGLKSDQKKKKGLEKKGVCRSTRKGKRTGQ